MSIVKNFNNLDTDNTLGGNNASDTVIPSQKAIKEYVDNNSGTSRNIGEIVASTLPLIDAGLHLLDGALIDGNGIYADFVDYITQLYNDNPTANCFTTESVWQSYVTTYGVCGKFVYDSVNNTVRLPKVTGIIEGTTDVNALGELIEAGLPNITGRFYGEAGFSLPNGCFVNGNNPYRGTTSGNSDNLMFFDASRSNSIYGNSSTVQPQTIKAFYYIVIATSTKTNIQVDIDEIATDLNGKADRDLLNVSDTGSIQMAKASMPSDKYINLTLGASGTTYTAPADGFFYIRKMANNLNEFVWMQNVRSGNLAGALNTATYAGMYLSAYVPVIKGSIMSLEYSATGSTQFFRFIYAHGSESEAN